MIKISLFLPFCVLKAAFATRVATSFTCAQRMLGLVQRGVCPVPQHVRYLHRPVGIC